MWRTSILLLSVVLNLVVLAIPAIPLGVPGEWTWPRQDLPDSIWSLLDRLLWPTLVAGGLLAFCGFVDGRILRASRATRAVFLIGLVLGAFAWLNAVRQAAESPHRELRPLWVLYDKYASGYFFETAFSTKSQRELLSTYEARMAKGDFLHEGTHPPGLFLLNWWALQATRQSELLTQFAEWTQPFGNVKMFRSVESQAAIARPLSRTEFAALCLVSFVSSLLAAMTVCPVYALVRLMCDSRTAWRAACLMVTIPSVAVFAPRSDIVYPFSAGMILWLLAASVIAGERWRQITLGVLAAVTTFVSLSVSLAHIPVIVAGGLFGLLTLVGSQRQRWQKVLGIVALMSIVFLILCVLWDWVTDCNLVRVWQTNLSNHASFYSQSPRTWWMWALVNPLELSFAAGLPLMLFSFSGLSRALQQIGNSIGPRTPGEWAFPRLVISLAATWVILWLSGKNMGEAARLWCFLTPWVVIIAAVSLLPVRTAADNGRQAGELNSLLDQSRWLLLLTSQFVVCTATVGRVSGYIEL